MSAPQITPDDWAAAVQDPASGRRIIEAALSSANGHLVCAHRHAPPDTDRLTLEHIRAAQALVEAVLDGVRAR